MLLLSRLMTLLKRTDVILFLLCVVVLTTHPELDLAISHFFYDGHSHEFIYKDQPLVHFIYVIFAKLPVPLLLILPLLAIKTYRRYDHDHLRKWRYAFLLACLLLGPGLLVNTMLKDNSIGRARPVQVENFAGDKIFSPAFMYSGQCDRNCSFVSGHAAMGFYFIALAWVLASPAAFYGGVLLGSAVGLVRIIQGGHFFSDVVFAFWAVYLVTALLGYLFALPHPLARPATSRRIKTLVVSKQPG